MCACVCTVCACTCPQHAQGACVCVHIRGCVHICVCMHTHVCLCLHNMRVPVHACARTRPCVRAHPGVSRPPRAAPATSWQAPWGSACAVGGWGCWWPGTLVARDADGQGCWWLGTWCPGTWCHQRGHAHRRHPAMRHRLSSWGRAAGARTRSSPPSCLTTASGGSAGRNDSVTPGWCHQPRSGAAGSGSRGSQKGPGSAPGPHSPPGDGGGRSRCHRPSPPPPHCPHLSGRRRAGQ